MCGSVSVLGGRRMLFSQQPVTCLIGARLLYCWGALTQSLKSKGNAMERRQFLTRSLAAGAGLWTARRLTAAESSLVAKPGDTKMPFQQPPLPFAMTALLPFLSEEQLTYHYSKHHAAYFKNLNALVEGKPEAAMSLREVIVKSRRAPCSTTQPRRGTTASIGTV